MRKHRQLIGLQELLDEDLDAICADLAAEFGAMSGGRLLVTGGGGFLGYYLVQSVLHWNDTRAAGGKINVAVYDNYARGVPEWLEALRGRADLELRRHDMIEPLPKDIGHFDYVVHAAGIASPIFYRAQPLKCIDANVNGLRNLLDYAVAERDRGQPLRGFLFYSSSEIYGDPVSAAIPTPEDYRGHVSCTGPRACYDETKRFGETMCVVYARQEEIPVRMARPFNNYGPGLKITDGRVISDFAKDIFAGRDIVMLSDGSPTRTFCYATDAITGYFKVLVRGGAGEPYNIGIDRPEISIANLAELIVRAAAEVSGYRGKVVLGKSNEADYLIDNPNRRCPVIDKARNELGFAPKVLIEDGIYRSLIWYNHNRNAAAQ
ncbi:MULTISPECIES: NAD-dependent epimerase/dehydratase family protein [Bradyrhizobium]|uniref:NAD-dependent dehydratase n=1 Tax=Bradyrhizobium neotropicale TaxID=1497615 RepID=A0A176ZHT9_9BRAD|nr:MULTISPECIES: NAD-dependent epimerase/dehydratase family protein [Bradyrhizobium]MDH2355957.1 NAD-dependent epimerase/dehydratase family protein [Bradyrhizobium sp. SSUT112]OAF19346.1 NAD-dependent dehydratase [Bradyrhizobium neotropicale]